MPKLHFPQPEFTTHSCDLPEGTTRVGRSSRNNLVLSDPSVSADHCELVVSWNEVIVRDHGSSNGTWVAGMRVNAGGQLPVNHGDIIRFGRVEARLELDGFPDDDATAVTAHFAAPRAVQAPADPKSFRKVIGNGSPGEDTQGATMSIPAPARPAPPKSVAMPQPAPAPPVPTNASSGRRWLKVVLLVVGVLAVAWLFVRSR